MTRHIPSIKAAYALQHAGIRPWEASDKEVAIAERLVEEFRYIEAAGDRLRIIVSGDQQIKQEE